MYKDTKTWNPAVGCNYDCIYCEPSFKRQLKRISGNPSVQQGYIEYCPNKNQNESQQKKCSYCKTFEPHYHPERLKLEKIPLQKQVFVFGHGDITFYNSEYVIKTLELIRKNKSSEKNTVFYLQSKNPICFNMYLNYFSDNIILLTTLETNRDTDYAKISKAPLPSKRYQDFYELNYKRKVVTIEPIMDFDLDIFSEWIINLKKQNSLEYVWIGYNSKPKQIKLPEPNKEKFLELLEILKKNNIIIKYKDVRNLLV